MAMKTSNSVVNSLRGIVHPYLKLNRDSQLSFSRLVCSSTCVKSDFLSLPKLPQKISQRGAGHKSFSTSYSCYRNNLADDPRAAGEENRAGGQDKKYFAFPLNDLNNLQNVITSRLNINDVFTFSTITSSVGFKCKLHLKWPEEQTFSGSGRRLMFAKREAALQALTWLHKNNHIDKNGKLLLSERNINNHFVYINECILSKVDDVLETFYKEVIPSLQSTYLEHEDETHSNVMHPILSVPVQDLPDLESWSKHLQKVHIPSAVSDLPVENYRDSIIKAINNNRIVIIKGETGCGKSTKIPQFILDDAIREGRGAFCNIAVSQPRRLTAIQLARRVAEERNDKEHSTVGYSVRFKSMPPRTFGGCIMFFTTGTLIRRFIADPTLEGISHVVLDEAHLRDTSTDMLMALLKHALKYNQNLKLIIMSATIDTEVFLSFYSNVGSTSVLEIPGRSFPVKSFFLNDLPESVVSMKTRVGKEADIDVPMTSGVIQWLHETKPDGAILVFVSGWKDMLAITELLKSCDNLQVIPVHSMVKDNSAAFAPSIHGKRKVILATNIAETSLTFPDVLYVVDCGVQKVQKSILTQSGTWGNTRRSLTWISKANVMQRKGRAGRVQPGESFHLFSLEEFERMMDQEPPRICSESIESLILTMKMIFPEEEADDLMSRFPTRPQLKIVDQTVEMLKNANLLTLEDELPTPLAKIVLKISTSLPLAITLVHGAVFRCLDFVSSVVACAETGEVNLCHDRATLKRNKLIHHNSSDHIASSKILMQYLSKKHLQDTRFLSGIENAMDLRKKLLHQVLSIIHGKKNFIAGDINVNEFYDEELVKCVLLHSPCSLLTVDYDKNLRACLHAKSGMKAAFRTSSVNHPLETRNLQSPFFFYLEGISSQRVVLVGEATSVSPLAVLLFHGENFSVVEKNDAVEIKAWRSPTTITVPSKDYVRIRDLRRALQSTVNYFVSTEVSGKKGPHDKLMKSFRRELIDCIVDTLKACVNKERKDVHGLD